MNQEEKNRGKKVKNTRDSSGERFARLAAMGEQVLHTRDFANVWNIRHAHTLHMTLSRYVAHGLLYRIQRGLYSIVPPSGVDPYRLGIKAIHGPAYISCESVLFDFGILNQPPRAIAMVSSVSRHMTLAGNHYRSRKLADRFLYNDAGIALKDGTRIATLPRAVADMLHVYPKKHFDAADAVPWNAARSVAHTVGYSLKPYDTATTN